MGCAVCPTNTEPVTSSADQCYQYSGESCPCEQPAALCSNPTTICDDRYKTIDESARINILGADGKCIKTLPRNKVGFLVNDGLGSTEEGGTVLTQRPVVPIPYIKRFVQGTDGSFLADECGNPTEAAPPGIDSFIVSDPNGAQNRWQGQKNVPGRIKWNGTCFVFEADRDTELPFEVEGTNRVHCGVKEMVVLTETHEEIVGGQCIEVVTERFAYRNSPSIPYGTVIPYAGEDKPEGWEFCEGGTLSKTVYPLAWNAIGYRYGGAADTFYLPDLRGRVIRGYDPSGAIDKDSASRTALYAGGNTGNSLGTYQDDAFQVHGHDGSETLVDGVNVQTANTTIGEGGVSSINYVTSVTTTTSATGVSVCTITDCHVGQDASKTSLYETRMKNVAMRYLIFVGCPVCTT